MATIDQLPFPGIPEPRKAIHYGERFVHALRVAAIAHGDQERKGSRTGPGGEVRPPVPYVAHPLGVCAIALEHGADEEEAIAALLHDLIEDVEPTEAAEATVRRFGKRVHAIVLECTDVTPGADRSPTTTAARKAAAVAAIPHHSSSGCLVAAADKLHNGRAIVADLRTHGEAVWGRFNLGRDGQLAYYGALVDAFLENPGHRPALVAELDRTVAEMHRLAGSPYERRTSD